MATQKKSRGFTLIELMIAMFLMSLVTATCIWVFRQSLGIYQKATGNAEINQFWRVAVEKINQDLSACLPLSSGQQRFLMISRFSEDPPWGKTFPRDYLSFVTTTRVQGDVTSAVVSYDITETTSGFPILWRYVQKTADLGDDTKIYREVLAQYCTMFRLEYLWKDPRLAELDINNNPVVPSTNISDAHLKQVKDPGIYLTLCPLLNEDSSGLDVDNKFASGGLNGANLLELEEDVLHAGASPVARVQEIFYLTELFDGVISGVPGGVFIPFRDGVAEPAYNVPGIIQRKGKTISAQTSTPGGLNQPYNRVILIRSPNLLFQDTTVDRRTLDPDELPIDITGNFVNPYYFTQVDDVDNFRTIYEADNPIRSPTYMPTQIRITMKIHNKSRTSMITRSKDFWIPSSGS